MKKQQYTVYIEQDEDGVYIGSVPSIPGCHAQGDTQEELLQNLKEVIALCIRNTDQPAHTKFVGIQTLEFV